MHLSIHTDHQALRKQLAFFLDDEENVKQRTDQRLLIDMVASHIADMNDRRQIDRFLNENFPYSANINRTELKKMLSAALHQDTDRKEGLKKALGEYLEKHSRLNIEGFLNFRLKDYNAFLKNKLRGIADRYLKEKEYEDFISLLTCFIEAQEPFCYQVHILPWGELRYRLFNESKVELTDFCMREFLGEMQEEQISFDDFLLSTLVSLAPRQVILHRYELIQSRTVIKTVQRVFGDHLCRCTGCWICEKNKQRL